jgi:hypothetical protein
MAEKSGFSPKQVEVVVPKAGSVTQDIELTPVSIPESSAVFPTGVNQNRVKLSGGAADPHWQVVAGPGITSPRAAVVVNEQNPLGKYFQSSSDSAWIWVNADGSGPINQGFTFRLEFALASVSATTRISGLWGCDNYGSITLNGKAPAGAGTGEFSLTGLSESNFGKPHNFMIIDGSTGLFQMGLNTLDVVVTDTGNPGGLHVTKLVLTL